MSRGIDTRAMLALGSGHLAVDFASGSLPALVPFLVDRFDLSYTLAAALLLASTFSSSLMQPLFGAWSDGHGAIWLLPLGIALGGVGIAFAADAPSYELCLLLVVASGIGVAAYHPEALKFAAYASGARRASGMSAFSIGGNVGYALGPVVAAPLVAGLGPHGGLLLMVPCLAVAAVVFARLPALRPLAGVDLHRHAPPGDDRPGALAVLLAASTFRSIAWYGLLAFVPLWEVSLGHSKEHGARLLALMLLAGGLGTVVAGPAADRLGLRRVLTASLVATPALILGYVALGGAAGAACLAGVGIATISTYGVTAVTAQHYLPHRLGLSSGLSLGLPIGLGGAGAVVLGAVADAADLRTALHVAVGISVAAGVTAFLLPPTRPRAVTLTDQSIASAGR
jgi:FSR family fosmidomycin resistance protein-like MFS transporter